MKTCPECCSELPDQAEVCHACGRRIIGKLCPECAEVSKAAARKCRYCSHDFAREEKIAVIEPYSAKASFLPTILLRGRLIPQEIHLSPEKILIKTLVFFGSAIRMKTSRGRRLQGITTTRGGFGTASKSKPGDRKPTA